MSVMYFYKGMAAEYLQKLHIPTTSNALINNCYISVRLFKL